MIKPPRFEVRFLGAYVSGEGLAGIVGAIVAVCVMLALYRLVVFGDVVGALLN